MWNGSKLSLQVASDHCQALTPALLVGHLTHSSSDSLRSICILWMQLSSIHPVLWSTARRVALENIRDIAFLEEKVATHYDIDCELLQHIPSTAHSLQRLRSHTSTEYNWIPLQFIDLPSPVGTIPWIYLDNGIIFPWKTGNIFHREQPNIEARMPLTCGLLIILIKAQMSSLLSQGGARR